MMGYEMELDELIWEKEFLKHEKEENIL